MNEIIGVAVYLVLALVIAVGIRAAIRKLGREKSGIARRHSSGHMLQHVPRL